MENFELTKGWTLRLTQPSSQAPKALNGRDIPARVPGCVHTDLLAAQLIEDPYLNLNENDLQWIGECDWTYATNFSLKASLLSHEHIELICDGLDTVAEIKLNGHAIGSCENMHAAYRFNVKKHLLAGANALEITFRSPLAYARAHIERLGERPRCYAIPYNFIRKMACNFGWDWGPTLVTSGIWQPIRLCAWNSARLDSVRPLVTRAEPRMAEVNIHCEVLASAPADDETLKLQAELSGPDGRTFNQAIESAASDAPVLKIEVPDPQRWWPRGHGEQPLYELRITLASEKDNSEQILDKWEGRIGLRDVRLNTESDEVGSAFTFEINGKPIFCKGANWIPDDCFPTRVTLNRYRQRIEQAAEANMNMLRIWGGGIYETKMFYDLCDELGIMVWQDFLFACAAYPEEPPFRDLVKAEARHQISRLSPHPSLVLWNGNNENIWGHEDWGWKKKLQGRTWGRDYYQHLLPDLVAKLDPSRPYCPGSPYSNSEEIHPLDDRHGCKHVWDAWNEKDYLVYRKYTPRFVSEFGHQGPPTYSALDQAIPREAWSPESPAMLHHQRASNGNNKLHTRLAEHFQIPKDFDDWMYLTQLNQARAVTCGVEWYRSRHPICQGTLYWQLNDCWPVTSWAAVDGYGNPKPLWHATRSFYADRILTFQPNSGTGLSLFAINDSDTAWPCEILLRRLEFSGSCLAEKRVTLEVPPRTSHAIEVPHELGTPETVQGECPVGQTGDVRGWWFFESDKELSYPKPIFDAHLRKKGDQLRLTLNAKSLLRDIVLYPDRIDPNSRVDRQLISLLPGETHEFKICSNHSFTLEDLTNPPIFQCANRFGKKNT